MGKHKQKIAHLPSVNTAPSAAAVQDFRGKILNWYDRHKRSLPWRTTAGEADPYRVWLSEVMLQQTTVAAVIPYFEEFTRRWPDVQALAAAEATEVMQAWAGLGYYARARNLLACARVVAGEYGGVFPSAGEELRRLPGIGEYTAAAIAAIAFGRSANVVDGNIERVMARYHALEMPLPQAKPLLRHIAGAYAQGQSQRPGDYAQALMDLGATICTPRNPLCALCPVHAGCAGYARGIATDLPLKSVKSAKPERFGNVFWITGADGRVLLERRPETGLLGGMEGLPCSVWLEGGCKKTNRPHDVSLKNVQEVKGQVVHVFTHFSLRLILFKATINKNAPLREGFFWIDVKDLQHKRLATVFEKAKKHFLQQVF